MACLHEIHYVDVAAKAEFLLAIYIGLFMNGAVYLRRFDGYAQDFTLWNGISAVVELAGTVLATFSFTTPVAVWQGGMACSGFAAGADFSRRKLLHDLYERDDRLRYRGLSYDHGY